MEPFGRSGDAAGNIKAAPPSRKQRGPHSRRFRPPRPAQVQLAGGRPVAGPFSCHARDGLLIAPARGARRETGGPRTRGIATNGMWRFPPARCLRIYYRPAHQPVVPGWQLRLSDRQLPKPYAIRGMPLGSVIADSSDLAGDSIHMKQNFTGVRSACSWAASMGAWAQDKMAAGGMDMKFRERSGCGRHGGGEARSTRGG